MRVPISYGPHQKFLARIEQDAGLNRPQAITLPRISFEVSNMTYDGERRLTGTTRNTKKVTGNSAIFSTQFAPAPYNIDFTLTVIAKYSEDAAKIVEQILPFFKPEWTTSVQIMDGFDPFDVPTVLNSVTSEEVYEGNFIERRAVTWTLTFTMKAYFFGPVTTKKLIKFSTVNLYETLTANTASERVRVYPGLTANNEAANFTANQVIQSTASATISANAVSAISVDIKGLGYSEAIVTIDPPPAGNTATATAIVEGYRVQEIVITDGGSGYVTAPNVSISAPDDVSISHTLINEDDNWDYIVIVEDV